MLKMLLDASGGELGILRVRRKRRERRGEVIELSFCRRRRRFRPSSCLNPLPLPKKKKKKRKSSITNPRQRAHQRRERHPPRDRRVAPCGQGESGKWREEGRASFLSLALALVFSSLLLASLTSFRCCSIFLLQNSFPTKKTTLVGHRALADAGRGGRRRHHERHHPR